MMPLQGDLEEHYCVCEQLADVFKMRTLKTKNDKDNFLENFLAMVRTGDAASCSATHHGHLS